MRSLTLSLLLLLSGPSLAQVEWYTLERTFPEAPNLRDIALADLDGDTFCDIVYVQFDPGAVFVRMGIGAGKFGNVQNIGAVPGAQSVALGHLDGDGIPDIAVTSGDVVTLFRGLGQGNFAPGLPFPVPGASGIPNGASIELEDLNGDGFDELLMNDAVQTTLVVGDCGGLFQQPSWSIIALNNAALNIVTGDINEDGHVDVVMSGGGFLRGAVLLGGPGLSFAPPVSLPSSFGGGANWVQLRDYDGDGHLDVLVLESDSGSSDAVIWKGNGDGSLSPSSIWEGYNQTGISRPIVSGDFNDDGKLDFISKWSSKCILSYVGLGSAVWFEGDYTCHGMWVRSFAVADLDQDGIDDLAVVASDNGAMSGQLTVHLSRHKLVSSFVNTWFSQSDKLKAHYMGLYLGANYGGFKYLVLGSMSGSTPGVTIGSNKLPLNWDAYTDLLFLNPNTLVHDSFGTLDSKGRAFATLDGGTPPLPPSLSGTTVHHAFVVVDPITFDVVWISKSLELEIK